MGGFCAILTPIQRRIYIGKDRIYHETGNENNIWCSSGSIASGRSGKIASADAVVSGEDTSYDRYIAFGQDLKASEKQKVLQQFGINESDLSDYKTIEITNQEEHDYLGDYIDAKVIGSRALSSVMIVKTEKGSGIQVETKNITYCTSGMYCNALVTAGLEDAQVTVVGPFGISGTSALVGARGVFRHDRQGISSPRGWRQRMSL